MSGSNNTWPSTLSEFAKIPAYFSKLQDLANLAEEEVNKWDYVNCPTGGLPVLNSYVTHTYLRLVEEGKIGRSDDGQFAAFDTGLVTRVKHEPIYAFFGKNSQSSRPWYLIGWKRKGEREMSNFSRLPEMAHYFSDPSLIVFDVRKDFRPNIEHIMESKQRQRFEEPYRSQCDDYKLSTFIKGAIENALERVRRNYKIAVPYYFTPNSGIGGGQGRIQLLLPLCISKPNVADVALAVEDMGTFYRAATCLDLDMAYNNARLLARPDTDWLNP